jgi:hypothetical protein
MKKFLLILAFILCAVSQGHAQLWSTLLTAPSGSGESVSAPQKWAVPWNTAGVVGGIPNRTIICSTTACATATSAGTSATLAQLNAALASCPSGDVVQLAAGTYLISGTITLKSNCTLRGAGTLTSSGTIINAHGTSGAVINFGGTGPNFSSPASATITSGATAGSTSIVMSSVSGISIGSLLAISEVNDPVYVSIHSIQNPSGCTFCDGTGDSGVRTRGQVVQVTNIAGTTLTITPALYTNYGTATGTGSALAYYYTPVVYAGVELLQIYANGTGYARTYDMTATYSCWISKVMDNYTDGDHVDVYWGLNDEIRDSYFSNAYGHSPGGADSDIDLLNKTSNTLVENNIVERLHVGIMLEWGAAGDVVAYNYSVGNFDCGSCNGTSAPTAILGSFVEHGAHPQFNLYEGNVGNTITEDSFWGSGANETLYRNQFRGVETLASPTNVSGRQTVNWSSTTLANQYMYPITNAFIHTNTNAIGNILGSADAVTAATNGEYNGGTSPFTSTVIPSASRNFQSFLYPVSVGYDNGPDSSGSGVTTFADGPSNTAGYWVGLAANTLFQHGNFDIASNSIIWNGSVTHTLPTSFFRSSKPAYFGSVAWPPIGPDVTGGAVDSTVLAGHVNAIPAEVCYNSESRDATSIKLFDPVACYYSSSSTNAPTTLNVIF